MSGIRAAVAAILLILVSACGGGVAAPSPVTYAGQWSGTTTQGTAFSFVVSPDQKITSIALGYSFNGCSGSLTFAADATITNIPTAPVPVGSASFDSGRDTANRTLISFLFTSASEAHGLAIFSAFDGCGSDPVSAPWTATRR